MSCVYHGINKGAGCSHVQSNRFKTPNLHQTFTDRSNAVPLLSAVVCYFCHCMSLHVCPGEFFSLDSHSAIFWERNCIFWERNCILAFCLLYLIIVLFF